MKIIENQERKQVEVLKVLNPVDHQQKPESIEGVFPKDFDNTECKNELNEIKKLEEKIDKNA